MRLSDRLANTFREVTVLGYTSDVINGQLVNVAPGQAFNPLTFGAQFVGPALWPTNSPYNVPPVLPSAVGASGAYDYQPSGFGPPAPTAGGMTKSGGANWFHPTKSPVLWAIGFVVVALVMLHKVHYKRG